MRSVIVTKKDISPRKKARQRRAKETVRAILQAATHILNHQGADRFTTNHIAKKAGVSIGSLYQYFPNKRAISSGILSKYLEDQGNLVLVKISEIESREELPKLISSVVRELFHYRTREISMARAVAYEISKGEFHIKHAAIKEELAENILLFLNGLIGTIVDSKNQTKVHLIVEGVDSMLYQLSEKKVSKDVVESSLGFIEGFVKSGLESLKLS